MSSSSYHKRILMLSILFLNFFYHRFYFLKKLELKNYSKTKEKEREIERKSKKVKERERERIHYALVDRS